MACRHGLFLEGCFNLIYKADNRSSKAHKDLRDIGLTDPSSQDLPRQLLREATEDFAVLLGKRQGAQAIWSLRALSLDCHLQIVVHLDKQGHLPWQIAETIPRSPQLHRFVRHRTSSCSSGSPSRTLGPAREPPREERRGRAAPGDPQSCHFLMQQLLCKSRETKRETKRDAATINGDMN